MPFWMFCTRVTQYVVDNREASVVYKKIFSICLVGCNVQPKEYESASSEKHITRTNWHHYCCVFAHLILLLLPFYIALPPQLKARYHLGIKAKNNMFVFRGTRKVRNLLEILLARSFRSKTNNPKLTFCCWCLQVMFSKSPKATCWLSFLFIKINQMC